MRKPKIKLVEPVQPVQNNIPKKPVLTIFIVKAILVMLSTVQIMFDSMLIMYRKIILKAYHIVINPIEPE